MGEERVHKIWHFVKKKVSQETSLFVFLFALFLVVIGITVAIEGFISYETQGHLL